MGHQHAENRHLCTGIPPRKKSFQLVAAGLLVWLYVPCPFYPGRVSTAQQNLYWGLYCSCSYVQLVIHLCGCLLKQSKDDLWFFFKMLFFRFKWWPLFPFPIARRHLCDGDRCEQNQTFSVSVHAACGTTPCLLQPCSKWIWLYESPM